MAGYCLVLLLTLIASGACKLVQLESYRDSSASVCIAIPPSGENYRTKQLNLEKQSLAARQADAKTEPDLDSSAASQKSGAVSSGQQTLSNSPESESIAGKSVPKRSVSAKQDVQDKWILTRPDDVDILRTSLQYFVKNNATGILFWAGQAIIPAALLTRGHHILKYQQVIVMNNKLALKVWWDAEALEFELTKDRVININYFSPHHVVLYGPATLQRSARALCYDDVEQEASLPVSTRSSSTLAVVGSCVLAVLLLVGGVTLVLTQRRYRSARLEIAGRRDPPAAEAVTPVAGSARDNSAYQ